MCEIVLSLETKNNKWWITRKGIRRVFIDMKRN